MKTMTKDNFEKLFRLCRIYDPFTMYIDNYRQGVEAEKCNKEIMKEFSNILKNYGIESNFLPYGTTVDFKTDKARTALENWLLNHEIKVVENHKREWHKEEIKRLLQTNDTMLYRSLKILYDFQTQDEKDIKDTKIENGVGFNSIDAKFLSSCAEFLIKNGFLTNKQKFIVRNKMIKYTGQLTKIANKG